jgi:hypothetical protein
MRREERRGEGRGKGRGGESKGSKGSKSKRVRWSQAAPLMVITVSR